MADDITLTVRVRDMTRGEFSDIRRRMRGMDGDIRGLANSSNMASDRADRLGRSIRGVSGRLGQMQRAGNMAGHEMDYMRRSMGLLNRDLRNAARAGEITEDEFRRLRDELDETRLGFDRLDNEIRRHSAVAQRRARDAAAAQREERRRQMAHGQQIVNEMRRINRAHDEALRENARRAEQAQREERRRQMAQASADEAHRRRLMRAWNAALREDEQRMRRQEAERQQSARRLAQIMRQQEAEMRRHFTRMAGMSDADRSLNRRFQGMDDGSLRRMTSSMNLLSRAVNGLNGETGSARRTIRSFGRDMDVLSQTLHNAARGGSLSRREYNALSNNLNTAERTLRRLRRSSDMSRSSFRQMRDEVRALRAQLQLLDRDGTVFQRLSSRMLLFQRRLRETRNDGNLLRRSLNRMGDGMVGGMRRGVLATGLMIAAMRKLGAAININRRWTAILIAVLMLLGPAAQVLGPLLLTVLGGAFIALGALALHNSKAITGAFQEMKNSVTRDVREAAQPLEQYLVFGMRQVSAAVQEMKPLLTEAFAATGPLVEPMVAGLTGLLQGALPGFNEALQNSVPAMQGFRDAMRLVGEGLGEMFAAMTAGGGAEALRDMWVMIGAELKNFLVNLGEFINMATQSGTATLLLVGVLRSFSGILHIVEAGLKSVDMVFGGLFSNLANHISNSVGFSQGMEEFGFAFLGAADDVDKLYRELKRVDEKIADIKRTREETDRIPGPYKERTREQVGATLEKLRAAQRERKALTQAIADAEKRAAAETREHASAVEVLRQSIQKLNQDNLSALDAQSAMEAAIDKAVKKAKDLKGKVSLTEGGVLDLDTNAGRQAQEVLGAIARTTNEYVEALKQANAPQDQINAAWERGRSQLLGLSGSLGVSESAMKAYADQVLATPESVRTTLKVEKEQADAAVADTISKIKKVPKEKRSQVVLEAQRAMERASMVESKLNALDGKTARTYVVNTVRTVNEIINKSKTFRSVHDIVGATGGKFTGRNFRYATGGEVSGLITGPGTGTSDDIFAPWLSNGEFVIRASMVKKYGEDFLQKLNAGSLEMPKFAKGGKVSKAEKKRREAAKKMREARDDLVPYLTVSRFGKMAGSKNSEFISALTKPSSRQDLVDELNRMRTSIKKSTSGSTERRLLKHLDAAGNYLLKHQKNLTAVNKSLEKAKDKLDDLKSSASQLKDSIKQGIIGELNLTRSASREESHVTLNTIMSQMTADAAQAKQFKVSLETLKKRGFSGRVLEQVAQAGVEGGGLETATALLSASSSQIKRINQLNQSIRDSADDAGDAASDAMYKAGIKAAEGLVKGLTSKQKSIERQMMNIAKAMEKAIKKALKIKSPSRVMEEVGAFTAEGFAVGMEKNNRPQHAWESMLNTPAQRGSRPVSTGSVSSGPMVIQLHIGGNNIGEVIIDPLRKSIRHRGGNVQAVLGK